ncbi:MAG: hypothetical protein KDD33_06285 [Bdellovibrionales bacterium]|nr:hypothetical protein [Bdellovibrionales bacterium]
MKILFALSLFIFNQPLWAQSFQPITVPMDVVEKVIIRGYKGKITLEEHKLDMLRIEGRKVGAGSYDQWKFQVRKKGNSLEVVVRGPSDTEDWEKIRQGSIPSFELKVSMPSRPVEIFWASGSVESQNWPSSLVLQMTDGDVTLSKGTGEVKAQVINAKMSVSQQKGNVEIQTYKGDVTLTGIEGALKVFNRSANYKITQLKGPSEFKNHSGTIVLSEAVGHMSLNNINGIFKIKDLEGSLIGDFQKGSLDVKAKSLQNFVLNTDSAPVILDVDRKSGAMVTIRSEKGHLRVPPQLRKISKGRWTEYKGRLKGDDQGQIKIVSKYGDIVLK